MPERIECDGCGRSFATEDPVGMLDAITGMCPTCGGSFRVATSQTATPAPRPSDRIGR